MNSRSPGDRTPVITGIGVLSPIGVTTAEFWASIEAGRHGIRPITRFATDGFAAQVGAELTDERWAHRTSGPPDRHAPDPSAEFALIAAREAWLDAKLDRATVPRTRIGLVMGTSAAALYSRRVYEFASIADRELRHDLFMRTRMNRATDGVARGLGLTGPTLTVSTACTSSTLAMAHACEWLAEDCVDVVLAGGVDVLLPEIFGGFYSTGAMSAFPCAPFSEPFGMNVGEGAGFVVIENRAHARARDVRVFGSILGYATALDAFHATSPDPTGFGVAQVVGKALRQARLAPEAIGYVNAHGTGTEANDAAESRGLRKILGPHADAIPISSLKGHIGHTLGAAGVLELIATVLAMQNGVVPPTMNFTRARGGAPRDPVGQATPRAHAYSHAVSINAGFGGHNAAVLVGTADAFTEPGVRVTSAEQRDDVFVLASAAFAAHGEGAEAMDRALHRNEPIRRPLPDRGDGIPIPESAATIPPMDLEACAPGVDLERLDELSALLLAVVCRALDTADARPRGASRERTGLYAAFSSISAGSEAEFWDSIRKRGYSRVSAPAFARIVACTPAGVVSRALSLRGPSSVMVGGPGTTMAALGRCAHQLGHYDDADIIVLAAVAMLNGDMLADHAFVHRAGSSPGGSHPLIGEAAIGLTLGRRRPDAIARIAGYADAGAEGLVDAIRRVLQLARCPLDAIDAVYTSSADAMRGHAEESAGIQAAFGASFNGLRICEPATVLGETLVADGVALAAAVEAIRTGNVHPGRGSPRQGRARSILAISARRDEGGSHAVLLRAPDS